MDDKVLTVIVSAGTAVVAAFVTSVLSSTRDRKSFLRQRDRDHLETVRDLYADAFSLIVLFSNSHGGALHPDQGEKFTRTVGLLQLLRTNGVVNAFAIAKEYSGKSKQAVVESEMGLPGANERLQLIEDKRQDLLKEMKTHLTTIELKI